MTFLLSMNKVIFLSGFCPAVSDARSGSEEEPLRSAPQRSDRGGKDHHSGALSLGWGLPGRYLKRCHSKCHCFFQPCCTEQWCWASKPRSPEPGTCSHTQLSWESWAALDVSRANMQPWSFTILRDADSFCWEKKKVVIRQGLAKKK